MIVMKINQGSFEQVLTIDSQTIGAFFDPGPQPGLFLPDAVEAVAFLVPKMRHVSYKSLPLGE